MKTAGCCVRLLMTLAFAVATTVPVRAQDHDHGHHHDHSANQPQSTGKPAVALPPFKADDWAADSIHGTAAMDAARKALFRSTRDQRAHLVLIEQLEWHARDKGDAVSWQGKAWYGGDIDRLLVRSEGEISVDGPVEAAEVQALWSHATGPFANLELGLRQDINAGPGRTHAALGIDVMLPYWIEMEGALFLSHKGDVHARFELSHDMRFSQALVLQPRLELTAHAQDVPELGKGAGLSATELGLRLRYAPNPAFGPYVGVQWERKFGDTARISRAMGESRASTSFVAGLRFWF